MLELAARLVPLIERGVPVAVATSIDVIGSAPHLVGTSMAVTADEVLGSVSNGCVEAAALADCYALLAGGGPVVRRYGFGIDAGERAGLSCGGELDVLVHAVGAEALPDLRAAATGSAVWLAIVTGGPAALIGRLVGASGVEALAAEAGLPADRLHAACSGVGWSGRPGPVDLDCEGRALRLFVDVVMPPRRLVIVGATETAAALAAAAAAVGYAVTVCEHRPALATPARFPGDVLTGLPHRLLPELALGPRDAVCLLTHDEDLDPLALAVALESAAGYVGALGSRRTAARREERLRVLGVPEHLIARLHAPIGLDLGASTPPETAVSILAEVIAARTAASGDPLRTGSGAIHRVDRR